MYYKDAYTIGSKNVLRWRPHSVLIERVAAPEKAALLSPALLSAPICSRVRRSNDKQQADFHSCLV